MFFTSTHVAHVAPGVFTDTYNATAAAMPSLCCSQARCAGAGGTEQRVPGQLLTKPPAMMPCLCPALFLHMCLMLQCKTRLETHFKNVDAVINYYRDCLCEVCHVVPQAARWPWALSLHPRLSQSS